MGRRGGLGVLLLAGCLDSPLAIGGDPPDLAQPAVDAAVVTPLDLATGDRTVRDRGLWVVQKTLPAGVFLTGIWGSGANDLYVVGFDSGNDGLVFHSTGDGDWSQQTAAGTDFESVWGSGPDDVYIAASSFTPALYHSAGDGAWTLVPDAPIRSSLWGTSTGDIYGVGLTATGQAVYHFTGGSWRNEFYGGGQIFVQLGGSGAADVFAVGSGWIAHSDGSGAWTLQPTALPQAGVLEALWAVSASDLYAVGTSGMIMHSDGDGNWSAQTSGFGGSLNAAWASGATDVFAGGANGTMLHSAGDGVWTTGTTGVSDTVSAMWASRPGDLYAVAGPNILHLAR